MKIGIAVVMYGNQRMYQAHSILVFNIESALRVSIHVGARQQMHVTTVLDSDSTVIAAEYACDSSTSPRYLEQCLRGKRSEEAG